MEFLQTRVILSQLRKGFSKSYGNGSGVSSGCIPDECHQMVLARNCTCARTLKNSSVCEETTTDPKIPVVLWSISAFILFILFLELILIRCKHSILDNFFGKSVFMIGIVSSMVTQLCTMQYLQDNSDGITLWYNVVLGACSMVFVLFGYHFLFTKSPNNNIGSHDRGMGLVIVIITILLVGLEIVLMIMVYTTENISTVFTSYLLVYACEKIVQVGVYIAVRRCNPHEDFERGAVYYFSFLSFLNFTLWLNSIPFTDIKIYDEVSHTEALKYIDDTFKALVIDYRLLCALLFLEHALAMSMEHNHPNMQDEEFEMPSQKRWFYTAIGIFIGLVFLALQIINGAQFWNKSIKTGVNICPILVDVTLVGLGLWLLKNVKTSLLHDKPVNLVLFMVTSMGTVSIVYLFIFGVLSLISFNDEPISYVYVSWSAWVFLARGLSLWVLLLVYTGISVDTMELKANHTWGNYVLVSALCVGLFARFIGSILDEFDGTMHKIAHHHLESNKLRSLQVLFVIGPLFQLAASLHLALHFLLMIWRLHEKPKDVVDERVNAVAEQGQGDEGAARPPNNDATPPNDGFTQPNVGFLQPNVHRDDSNFETSGVHGLSQDERTPLISDDTGVHANYYT